MKQKKLHMIGNAHIDPVWLWQWQEGFHEVKATFRSALDRMKEYDDFIFTASSAAFYDWVEKSDPAMFAEIRQRVQEGRWRIVGGWWVEPDCNIPCGESFARHALYAQRYFKEKFGVTATVGYAIDSFGHNGNLPALLQRSGMPYYVFMRPMPFEKGLPGSVFWWEADDGSRVLTLRLPFEYLSWGREVDDHVRRCAAEMKDPLENFVCFYGVGNHGGGPTKSNIESIYHLNTDPDLPELVFSGLEDFFRAIEFQTMDLPVVHTDLQHHASGCYAAHSGIKRLNRQCENRLQAAEKWSIAATWTLGLAYPSDFAHAWKNVLFNQFHDILAGTSLEAAYEDARNFGGEALAIADRNLNLALQAFAWRIRIQPAEGMRPLVVFNPLTWQVKATIEIESNAWNPTAVLLDDQNRVVPHQALQSTTATWRVRLCFNADLPALGYRTYRLFPELPAGVNSTIDHGQVAASDTILENEMLRLEFDPESGCIASLFDKEAGVQVFSGKAARPVVIDDPSDTWSHNVFKFDKILGQAKACSVRLAEHGPARSVIRVISEWSRSRLVQDFALSPGKKQVDVRAIVDWREQFQMLKLRFPINVKYMKVTHEIPFGTIERFANGEEEGSQSWVDISGFSSDQNIPYGFSLLNDGKYSLDVTLNEIGLTVLRSPAYAHHIPSVPKPNGLYAFIDQGLQCFNYTLLPHRGSWEQAQTPRRAAELNQPPNTLFVTYHPEGDLPLSAGFIDVDPPSVLVSLMKQAEDGNDLILRAYETNKSPAHGVIRLPAFGRVIETDFRPGEIKTLRVPRDASQPVKETDFLEG
ncbi:MAG TPA: glycoside hydrolase family 38 C-terminal domain-containing protein [Anaerolineaceae bacterium]